MGCLCSEEVNFLIFRYLLESGFTHSAFTFGHETLAYKSAIEPSAIPSGALISLIQKGVQLLEIEAKIEQGLDVGAKVEYEWAYELLKRAKKCTRPRDGSQPAEKAEKRKKAEKQEAQTPTKASPSGANAAGVANASAEPLEVQPQQITSLQGHEGEVFTCCWHPKSTLLASGSGDATARIWTLEEEGNGVSGSVQLAHDNKEVTTLDWSHDGKLLATGSYDGVARLWAETGGLRHTLKQHTGPIFSLKFNKEGRYLLTGSVDNTAIIWDTKSGKSKQQFAFHTAAALDVDWKDEFTFASCSQDMCIFVCRLGESRYLKKWEGHTNEVNACKWDTEGHGLLASCSDDRTAKVWAFDSEEGSAPKCNFTDHTREIYTLKWSPGRSASCLPLLLATASFDCTVRLWDVNQGKCQQTLAKHTDAVYSVAFSPDGRFLASGASDKCLNVWSVKNGTVVRRYRSEGGIFEVGWNAAGTKVACSCNDRTVRVIDLRL
eukprot:EG_transcript_9566